MNYLLALMMATDLGIVANKPSQSHELILKRWNQLAKEDTRVKKVAEKEKVNLELIMKGGGSEEMKAKWAKLLR